MNDEIVVIINKRRWTGWKEVRIQKSLDQMAGVFSLDASDFYPGRPDDFLIKMGHEVEIEIAGETVITGYIDDMNINYGEKEHSVTLAGRDRTGDLVDCSYMPYEYFTTDKAGLRTDGSRIIGLLEWKSLPIIDIINNLCEPFRIVANAGYSIHNSVQSPLMKDTETFTTFNIEGESVAELIRKICHTKAILPVSYGDIDKSKNYGILTLTRAGQKKTDTALVVGQNIKSAAFTQSNKNRYSTYIVKGQNTGVDSQSLNDWIQAEGVAYDDEMKLSRFRPKIFVLETAANSKRCEERANWEKSLRAGNSRKITYEVIGWTQNSGKLWPLNQLVEVEDSKLGISKKNNNSTLLISDIEYSCSERMGKRTKMSLVDQKTYELIKQPMKLGFPYDLGEEEEQDRNVFGA